MQSQNDILNIDVILFKHCNMNCLHCFQAHPFFDINLDYIKQVPENLWTKIDIELKKHTTYHGIKLSVRGGEIFQDIISNEIFIQYKRIFTYIKTKLKENYPNFYFLSEIISNGMFTKIDRVIDLLTELKTKISLSYDSWGRFHTEKQKEIYNTTYSKLLAKNLIELITITLTKHTINTSLLTNDLLKFNKDNVGIDFNYYIPLNDTDKNSATDTDLFNFFKYLVDNRIFKNSYITDIIKNILDPKYKINTHCNCKNIITFYNNTIYRACHVDEHEEDLFSFYGKETINIKNKNAVKIITDLGINKRGCKMCENYNNCSGYCWMTLAHKYFTIQDCPHKKIKKYINKNKKVLIDYIEWNKSHE